MKTSTKLIITGSFMGAIGLAGALQLTHAAQSQSPVAIMAKHRSSHQIDKTGDGDGETNDDAKEQAEEQQDSDKLQPLAKITPQQAQQSAETAQGGQASRVNLENDDGNLVYAVVIGQQEVKVDAGNGRVLYTEALNQDNNQMDESHPRSSIQVTKALGDHSAKPMTMIKSAG